jgi:hypothetical protein
MQAGRISPTGGCVAKSRAFIGATTERPARTAGGFDRGRKYAGTNTSSASSSTTCLDRGF